MAMHTQNLNEDPRCSLFVAQVGADGDALGAARATLMGNAEQVPEIEIASVREKYLTRMKTAATGLSFPIFQLLPSPAC